MSFLVKKAGAPGHREKSLPLIVQHAKEDLRSVSDTRQFGLYYHGIMTLFAEAMKGNGLSIHTSGPAIFQSLFKAFDNEDLNSAARSPWIDVVCGVLISTVHHTSSDTFKDILEVVLECVNEAVELFRESSSVYNLRRLLLAARLIGIVAGVRKGTRIRAWPTLLKSMFSILQLISKNTPLVMQNDQNVDLWGQLVLSVSIIFQYAPMDALIPQISGFMDCLIKDPLAKWFLTFCSYFSEVDQERFRSITLPYFQRYVTRIPITAPY
jgi:U3 small nucleolar RNA-associated protein 20